MLLLLNHALDAANMAFNARKSIDNASDGFFVVKVVGVNGGWLWRILALLLLGAVSVTVVWSVVVGFG